MAPVFTSIARRIVPEVVRRVDVLHQRQEALADVIVPVGQCAAAVLKPSISILVFATRRLNLDNYQLIR